MKAADGGDVNNGGNVDPTHMMFTSDVSLQKDDKQLCLGKQITVGQLTEL